MICNLPRAQVERFIQYTFVKIVNENLSDFYTLAHSIYGETAIGDNKNAYTYLQMLPSVFMTLYVQRKEVQNVVDPAQLAIAGPLIQRWENIDNIIKDLNLGAQETSREGKLFIDTGKDLSIREFNRIYQRSPRVVEGEQAWAATQDKDYIKNTRITVGKYSRKNLPVQFVPVRDMNGVPVASLQTAVQHEDFYVMFEHRDETGKWNNMGYIKPLQYFDNGKLITLDELSHIIEISPENLVELKAMEPLYNHLFSHLAGKLGDKVSVSLSLEEAGISIAPNYNKFDILQEDGKATNIVDERAMSLSDAGDMYRNNGKGHIVKAWNGQYLTIAEDPDAPELPQYTDEHGNPKPFRGYYALTTMPNGMKYWVGIRPAQTKLIEENDKKKIHEEIKEAAITLTNITSPSPDHAAQAESVANALNEKYYFFTGTDYNIFFMSNYNPMKKRYVLRADFLRKNASIGAEVPALYFDRPGELDNINSLLTMLNTTAQLYGLQNIRLLPSSIRYNIPYDRVNKSYERMTDEKASAMFATTVGPNIFDRAFFTITPVEAKETGEKLEDMAPDDATAAALTKQKEIADAMKGVDVAAIAREVVPGITEEALKEIQKRAEEAQRKAAEDDTAPFKLRPSISGKPIESSELESLRKMLPKHISVEDLDTIAKNLNHKGIALGHFKGTIIYLASTAERGTAFHEAFHAIFRTVLTDKEINNLLSEGRKALLNAKPTALNEGEIKAFIHERGYDITPEQAEDLIVEEYLADKFADFKLKRDSRSLIAKLFDKIAQFVKWLTNTSTDLEKFYTKAADNKFADSGVAYNRFNNIGFGAYSLIPNTSGFAESDSIVRTVAARFIEDFDGNPGGLDAVLDEMAYFYALTNNTNKNAILKGELDPEKLAARMAMYTDPTTRKIIKEEVLKLTKSYDYNIEDNEFEDLENEYGRAAGEVWDKSIDEFGGFDSVSKEIKAFILFTTYQSVDELTGNKVRKVIDGEYVYANLERALSGRDPKQVIEGLQALAKVNPQIDAVYQKLKSKTGLVESTVDTVGNEASFTDLSPENYADNLEGKQMMIKFLKSLEKNFLNHLQVLVTYTDDSGNKTKVISSNRQDAPAIQLSRWQNNYLSNIYDSLLTNDKLRTGIAKDLSDFSRLYNSKPVTQLDLDKLQVTLNSLGLEFAPAFLTMSFGSKDNEVANRLRKAFPDKIRLTTAFLDKVAEYLYDNKNIFEKGDITTEIDEEGNEKDLGLTSTIKNLIASNVTFDSDIFQTNFQTADNKTRYSYVYPNYFVNKTQELSRTLASPEAVKELMANQYYKYNHLVNLYTDSTLNAGVVAANFRNMTVEITGDIREEVVDELMGGKPELQEGIVFKNTDDKSLLLTNLALYDQRENRKVTATRANGVTSSVPLTYARFWPVQLEAKSTMFSVKLPVIDGLYRDGKLTNDAKVYLSKYLNQEIARIGILTKPRGERNKDYNIDNKRNEFVYFKGLNHPTVDAILKITRDSKGNVTSIGKPTAEGFQSVMNILEALLNVEFAAFKTTLANNNIYGKGTDLLNSDMVKHYGGADNYLGSFFYNHLLNAMAFRQLLVGDESQFKDDIDMVKRAGGLLAFGISRGNRTYTTAYTTEALSYVYANSLTGDNADTTHVTKNADESDEDFAARVKAGLKNKSIIEINTDDGGSEMTTQEFIDIHYDLGRLTSDKLEALNLLRDGIKPNSPEEERYRELTMKIARRDKKDPSLAIDGVSMKLVSFGGGYMDGNYTDAHNIMYDKMSVAVLFKNFTSRWDEKKGVWVPQKGLEALHNKRVWMEKNGIGQVNPKSAGKLKTGPLVDANMFKAIDFESAVPEYTPMQRAGKNQRLQVEVASHGMGTVTSMTQAIQLIDTETSDKMNNQRAEFQRIITELRKRAFDEAYSIVAKDTPAGQARDIKFFLEKVRDTILSTTPNQNMLEFLQTEGTDTKYDFNIPAVLTKLENIFLAHFNDNTLVQKMPGRTFVLRSPRDYNIIFDKATGQVIDRDTYLENPDKYETDAYGTRELRVHKDVNGVIQKSEIVISRGSAKLHGLKIGDVVDQGLLEGFGVRMPTQSHHSMIPFVVVDFLPDYLGDTVIIPKEIIYLSGADFDIDKIFAYLKDYHKIGSGRIMPYTGQGNAEQRYDEYLAWEAANNKNFRQLKGTLLEEGPINELRARRKSLLQAKNLGPLEYALDSFEDTLVNRLLQTGSGRGIFKESFGLLDKSLDYIYSESKESKKKLLMSIMDELDEVETKIAEAQLKAHQEAAQRLGFYTKKDFEKDPELRSRGSLANRLIDLYIEFSTNPEVAESLRTPASMAGLQEDADFISSLSGRREGRFMGTSINGILDSWRNNVQGKRLVGIWANTNIVNASFTKYKAKLNKFYSVAFDGKQYDDFGRAHEDDLVLDADGTYKVHSDIRRKGDSISAGVSAATDNAKERLMAKLGYTDDNTGVYSMMMALSIGRTRTNLFAAQPALLRFTDALKGLKTSIQPAPGNSDFELNKAVKEALSKVRAALKARGQSVEDQAVGTLTEMHLRSSTMIAAIKGELSGLDLLVHEARVLKIFESMVAVQEAGRHYARLLSLNRGITSKFDHVSNLIDSAEELDLGDLVGRPRKTDYDRRYMPVQVRDFILPSPTLSDSNIRNNVTNLKSIDKVSKKFFIKNTDWFKDALSQLSSSTLENALSSKARKKDIKYAEKALFNYVTMKAYAKWLQDNRNIELSNYASLVYNNLGEKTLRTQFRELLSKPEFFKNELVKFIETDTYGIQDRVKANTRLKSTARTEERFVDSYDALLRSKDPEIARFAANMFGYLLARNGAMFANASFVKFIKPTMFKNMANVLKNVNRALATNNDTLMRETTGESLTSLRGKFYLTYLSDVNVYPLIKKVPVMNVGSVENPIEEMARELYGTSSKDMSYVVYRIDPTANGFVVRSIPIKTANSLGGNKFISYVTGDNDVITLDPPKAFKYTKDTRGLYILRKIDKSTDDKGYTSYTFTYGKSSIFGNEHYNPYTMPYEFSVDKFGLYKPKKAPVLANIDFQEEPSTGYKQRTIKNASADATIAIAVDFSTAGEALTKKSVVEQGKKYIPVDGNNLTVTPARVKVIVDKLNEAGAKSLNIAGNGIYTMNGKYLQEEVDEFTYQLLKAVLNSPELQNKITSIRTGGQTGFDEAGAKAGVRLGIPTMILAPKGWKFRTVDGKDVSSEAAFKDRFTNISSEITKTSTSNTLPSEQNNVSSNIPQPNAEQLNPVAEQQIDPTAEEPGFNAYVEDPTNAGETVQPTPTGEYTKPGERRDIVKAANKYLEKWLLDNPVYIDNNDYSEADITDVNKLERVTLQNYDEAMKASKEDRVVEKAAGYDSIQLFDPYTDEIYFDLDRHHEDTFNGFSNIRKAYADALQLGETEYAEALQRFASSYGIDVTSLEEYNPNQLNLWDTEDNDSDTPFDC